MNPLLRAEAITKSYAMGDSQLTVLNDISLTISAGEMTAIVGASGSGKTTLLQILGTLASPTSGSVYFQNSCLTGQSDRELALFRNKSLGFIFQFHHLLPEFSALENVMMPGLIFGKSREAVEPDARLLLDQVELGHRYHHRVAELSGGEQQRTALARALSMNPAILLADEPTGNLDSRAGNLVFDLLQNLCKKRSMAVIMVTHNLELADRMDRTFTLKDGALCS